MTSDETDKTIYTICEHCGKTTVVGSGEAKCSEAVEKALSECDRLAERLRLAEAVVEGARWFLNSGNVSGPTKLFIELYGALAAYDSLKNGTKG